MVSKKLFSAVVASLVILGVVGGSSVAFGQVTVTRTTTITQTAASLPDFSKLVSLLNQTNLTETLNKTTDNYTLLAPTNEAFAALNNTTPLALLSNDTLKQILLNHVIDGKVNFTKNGTVTTLAGNSISYTVNGTKVQFANGATASTTAVNTTNGPIYTVDKVLVPPAGTSAAATASATAAGGFLGLPGFEAVYAVAGLLVVAYLVLRRRK
ncbi:MAG: fasciclin domain-containing protein [Halobacteriota archaeon]